MKKISAILFAVLLMGHFGQFAFAEETTGEKIEKSGNDAKRGAQKAGHRTEEAVKSPSDKAMHRAQAKNRLKEDKTKADDKVKEINNKID